MEPEGHGISILQMAARRAITNTTDIMSVALGLFKILIFSR